MKLSLRCRYLSVLQVVAVVVCCRGKVYCDSAQGCVGSELCLSCPETNVIRITNVVLGKSNCPGTECCITDDDCTQNASEIHRTLVRRECHNKQNCTVDVVQEQINCGRFWTKSDNNFERIAFDCTDEPPTSETEQGCIKTQLSLRCPEPKFIWITAVVLGDSSCTGTSCCIKHDDCTQDANNIHRTDVYRRCDNKQNCTVDVVQENIRCGYFSTRSYSDFERITYDCRDELRNNSLNSTDTEPSHHDNGLNTESTVTVNGDTEHPTEQDQSSMRDIFFLYETSMTPEPARESTTHKHIVTSTDGTHNPYNTPKADDQGGAEPGKREPKSEVRPVVVVVICFVILLAIVALVVVMYRRKKRAAEKIFLPLEMTPVDSTQSETVIYGNETNGTSLHGSNDPLPLYSLADEADIPNMEEDPPIYSEVEDMTTASKKGQNLIADQTTMTAKNILVSNDEYRDANKPPKSAFEMDKVDVNIADNIYELTSGDLNEEEDVKENKAKIDSSIQLKAEAILENAMSQEDDGQTVIENDLYSLL